MTRQSFKAFRLATALTLAVAFSFVACGDDVDDKTDVLKPDAVGDSHLDSETPGEDIDDADRPDMDVEPDDGVEPDDDVEAGDDGEVVDVEPDIEEPPMPELLTKVPLTAVADPLAGTDLVSCPIYQEMKVVTDDSPETDGTYVCRIYDTKTAEFVDDPPELLERAYLFDRWRDLYNLPSGQAADRFFKTPATPDMPEDEWGREENIFGYYGTGDSGIWTGWSTVAAILRYSQTGTEADYQRMEKQVSDMIKLYEATGIPGYLSRYHFLLVDNEAPIPGHIVARRQAEIDLEDHHNRAIPEAALEYLPDEYKNGYTDENGMVWTGTPMWRGRPSIDQNTGPMTSLPMAYHFIRDQKIKDRIVHHLSCYAKRLQRIEIINLQSNPDILEALMNYFAAGELKMDEGDIDLTKTDKIVGYVHRQVNPANEATFDFGCPETMQIEPWRVIDATAGDFIIKLIALVGDMDTKAGGENQIDHFYWPSIRGGDAMHLMHLMAMNYHLTGDEQYREFLYKVLINDIKADQVMLTAGGFSLPKFCKKYYGDQITYGPWWNFIHLLDDSPLRDLVQRAFHEEMWDKLIKGHANLDFEIMYAGALDPEFALDKDEALAEALELLPFMGGNGWHEGNLMSNSPRRSYTLDPEFVLDNAPEGTEAVCPTQQEYEICTAEVDVMGAKLPGLGVSPFDCTGGDWECPLPEEGKCTAKMTNKALPPHLRPFTDFLWQRNPFAIGATPGVSGDRQYPGSDYSEPFWNAMRYGFITEGAGQVLVWQKLEPPK